MTRSFTFGAVVVAVTLCRPANAIACGCGGPVPSSLAARSADVIFVGSVARVDHPQPFVTSHQNADGSVSTTVNANSGPDLVVFDVVHVYKGPQVTQLGLVRGNTSCDMPFMAGEKWIVYGEDTIGGVRALGCSRTRLYSDGEQDVIYLENSRRGGGKESCTVTCSGTATEHLATVCTRSSSRFGSLQQTRVGDFQRLPIAGGHSNLCFRRVISRSGLNVLRSQWLPGGRFMSRTRLMCGFS
jgi:hypothetical protein